MPDIAQFTPIIANLVPYPPIFISIGGAHLYGFASPSSDVDLRGCHLLPVRTMLGLGPIKQEIRRVLTVAGAEVDLVSEDLVRYVVLVIQQRGNYLEQLYSPLVVIDSPWAVELRELVRQGAITRHAYHHYAGFARGQWQRWRKEITPAGALKALLYAYRVSLTGLHLLRTGEIEPDLGVLAPLYGYHELLDLIAAKKADADRVPIAVDHHETELARLQDGLAAAYQSSPLPAEVTNREALDDFVVRVRLSVFRHELG